MFSGCRSWKISLHDTYFGLVMVSAYVLQSAMISNCKLFFLVYDMHQKNDIDLYAFLKEFLLDIDLTIFP